MNKTTQPILKIMGYENNDVINPQNFIDAIYKCNYYMGLNPIIKNDTILQYGKKIIFDVYMVKNITIIDVENDVIKITHKNNYNECKTINIANNQITFDY